MTSDDDESPIDYFSSCGLEVRLEERDLHAEYVASGEPGRATFFVEGRSYVCVSLVSRGGAVWTDYATGESEDAALRAARRRHGTEQGTRRHGSDPARD